MAKRDALAEAAAKAGLHIVAAHERLALKLRERAQRALEKAGEAGGERKRGAQRRRFELYGDAATEAEQRVADLRLRFGLKAPADAPERQPPDDE